MSKKHKKISSKTQTIILAVILSLISISTFVYYYQNGLGVAYNDARSHLDIGRRVVEGLQTGMAQLGSVWLPLPHILMTLTIWNNFMWHSGLAGAMFSMISYIGVGIIIFKFLEKLNVNIWGRIAGVAVFAFNPNVLYLQSTAMTELLLLFTMMMGTYYFFLWCTEKNDDILLVQSALWIMLSTLVRYDGWFLFLVATILIVVYVLKKKGYYDTEGRVFLFCLLGGAGIMLWLLWNYIIFGDPLYFAFGPYSAHSQQESFANNGLLLTKDSWFLSSKTYLYAAMLNIGEYISLLSIIGIIILFFFGKISRKVKYALLILFSPLVFNILALYLGHSILFIPNFNGMETWFNIRYGMMIVPMVAIFIGFLVGRIKLLSPILMLIVALAIGINFYSEPVTIADAKYGKSQKNVNEIAEWLNKNVKNKDGLILISVASHDSIIFSSGLPMKKFIHEGVNSVWLSATQFPDQWARWIVMMPEENRNSDFLWKAIGDKNKLKHYRLVGEFPYAVIYQLNDEYFNKIEKKTNEI
jgi:hypothetical protein